MVMLNALNIVNLIDLLLLLCRCNNYFIDEKLFIIYVLQL